MRKSRAKARFAPHARRFVVFLDNILKPSNSLGFVTSQRRKSNTQTRCAIGDLKPLRYI
jgi:hypothetical protein